MKKFFALFFIIFTTTCIQQKIKIKVENENKRYIIKKMSDKLILCIKSDLNRATEITIIINNFTDDYSDMPIYKKNFKIYKGLNYVVINLSDIGLNKFGMRIYYRNKLIDYRIIEVQP